MTLLWPGEHLPLPESSLGGPHCVSFPLLQLGKMVAPRDKKNLSSVSPACRSGQAVHLYCFKSLRVWDFCSCYSPYPFLTREAQVPAASLHSVLTEVVTENNFMIVLFLIS